MTEQEESPKKIAIHVNRKPKAPESPNPLKNMTVQPDKPKVVHSPKNLKSPTKKVVQQQESPIKSPKKTYRDEFNEMNTFKPTISPYSQSIQHPEPVHERLYKIRPMPTSDS